MMTSNQMLLIQLLRMSIAGESTDCNAFAGADWMALIEELCNQATLGLAWSGVEKNPKMLSMLTMDDKLEFYGQTRKVVERNKEVNKAVCQIVSALNEAGINSILLKGQGCASFYPDPLYRSSGDIDLLVGKDNFYKAQECLKKAGLVSDWIHEDMVHGMLTCGDVTLELHKFAQVLVGKKDEIFQKAVLPCLGDCYDECPRVIIDDTEVALLPIELNAVFTFIHMFRHFVGYGIQLRQPCDWLLMMRRITETQNLKASAAKTEQYLKDFGFLNAWKIFAQMAVECMGIPAQNVLLYEKGYSKNAPKVLDALLKCEINEFEIENSKPLHSIFSLLMFYKSYFKQFSIFPKECLMLLAAIVKINVQKNLLGKM